MQLQHLQREGRNSRGTRSRFRAERGVLQRVGRRTAGWHFPRERNRVFLCMSPPSNKPKQRIVKRPRVRTPRTAPPPSIGQPEDTESRIRGCRSTESVLLLPCAARQVGIFPGHLSSVGLTEWGLGHRLGEQLLRLASGNRTAGSRESDVAPGETALPAERPTRERFARTSPGL